jgi:hypothetical protein
MAGRQAARAIDGRPRDIFGEPPAFAEHAHRRRRRPRYVERGFDLSAPPPYLHQGVDLHAFYLRADPARLRALVDATLNEPAAGAVRYVPAAPLVVLGCAFVETITPATGVGQLGEIDVAFWIPVVATVGRVRRTLAWFMPWVFVDNPVATAIGREVYGFPKLTCDIRHRVDEHGLASVAVRGLALARLEPGCRAEPRTIVEVRRRSRAPARAGGGALTRALVRGLGLAQRGLDAAVLRPGGAGGRSLPLVFLRQLRDVRQPELAAYQAIIEAPARLTRYRGASWLGDQHDLAIADSGSLPLVRELGLESATPRPLLASRARFDFVMERGRELWRGDTGDTTDASSSASLTSRARKLAR